jgi:type IV secretory pathway TraG/TraD family ATPase VirD4
VTLTDVFSLPWYTYVVLAGLIIVGIGCVSTLVGVVCAVIASLYSASWRGLLWLTQRVCGIPLWSSGSAHFASEADATTAGVFRATGIALAQWQTRLIREPRNGHVLVMAPPRTYKTFRLMMPAIVGFDGVVVVNDMRGEIYRHTHAGREARGPVVRWAPAEPDSCALNLLDMIHWGEDDEHDDLHRLCHQLVMPWGEDGASPFQVRAVPLLMAIALHCRLESQGDFPSVLAWMTAPALPSPQALRSPEAQGTHS